MSIDTHTEATMAADPAPDVAAADGAQSPEQVMQAAAARLAALEAERDDFRDRWMRSEAEAQNVRARARREVEDARQFAVQKFARDVAEATENLRRGLDSLPPTALGEAEIVAKLRDGFEGVERAMLAALERNGVSREDPTGKPFDANLHQGMGEQVSDAHPPGTVLQAYTPAWTLNGRLLRPAMVVVSKGGGVDRSA
ncbi:MAG: nucleotide exchange factor GrpE [Janthinobacterium lividum]